MTLITFEDKVATRESHLPRKNDITAEDINEIKRVVNENASGGSAGSLFWTVDLLTYNTYTAIAPFNMKGTEVDHIDGNPTFTITINGNPFVLNDTISAGATIVFSVADVTAFNFYFERVI